MAVIGIDITHAISLLTHHKPVAIPTETVYGLAADAFSTSAIETVFTLKKRPKNRTLALNIHPNWDILQWVEVPPIYVNELIKRFWPGPLTLVLGARKNCLLPELIGPHHSVALRCPNHPITLALLQHYGKPLIAPSANPSDDLSPCSAQAVHSFFADTDLYILDGQTSEHGLESTILRAIDDKHYEILRQGAISLAEITQCIGFKATKVKQSDAPEKSTKRFYFSNIDDIKPLIQYQPLLIASKETIELFPILETHLLSTKDLYALLELSKRDPQRMMLVECSSKQNASLQDRIKKFCLPLNPEYVTNIN